MALPPVRMRDVFQHGLAAIAEARSLHGAGIQRAAQLVHHEGRERFAFDFFRDDQQRLAAAAICSSTGSRSFMLLIFFSWIRMYGSSSTTSIRSGSVTK